ncbi:MAG: ABC transporter ATP-binding protein/permease, partial [Methylocystis sp.]
MRKLSAGVAVCALFSIIIGVHKSDVDFFILAVACALCAFTTLRGAGMSSFMKIFACIFAAETIIFGFIRLLQAEGIWPQALVN